jgi:hypothetical protein
MEVSVTRINKQEVRDLPSEYEMTPTSEAYSALGYEIMRIIEREGESDSLVFKVEYDDPHYINGKNPLRRAMIYALSTQKDPMFFYDL